MGFLVAVSKMFEVPWMAPACPEGTAEASIEGPGLKLQHWDWAQTDWNRPQNTSLKYRRHR